MLSTFLWGIFLVIGIVLIVLWDKKRQKRKHRSYVYSEENQKELEVKKAIERERSRRSPR
ncbi:hypothetical protein E3U55_07605 [Filobacillus milosensis]|uniref:Uncharacterized protein n=1 Tax=Filobacillus milosensis TaxID=94137 RepID=A0A4Y8ILH7_9BACI|nr:hypothetical protein [Filobacillus milosensis]TFB22159.1 hypothetical protein E3U55_07605 [Filobacillus milosensis]